MKTNIGVIGTGFTATTPLAHFNIKRFLNHCPAEKEMLCGSQKNKINLDVAVSFTDGIKIQIEQAVLADGFGFKIVKRRMIGKDFVLHGTL